MTNLTHCRPFQLLVIGSIFLLVVLMAACQGGREDKKASDTADSTTTIAVKENPNRDVYWGDQHLHTSWSADAGASGTRVGPEEALRFARGEEVESNTKKRAKLSRPLDWLCVSDHSDAAGVINAVIEGDPEVMKDPIVAKYHEDMKAGGEKAAAVMMDIINRQATNTLPGPFTDPKFAKTIWDRNVEIVEKYNEPGKFTAFIAFEWTSNYGGGNNLHRNVIYRDGGAIGKQVAPMTTFESENPEDLWKWMANFEAKTGGKLLAIPHNGNLSNGLMFQETAFDGSKLTPELAKLRNQYEVLYEVTQCKGTSETHPLLSPNDEFADFELWDKGNLVMVPKKNAMLKTEYIRQALGTGLKLETQLGVNPFKYGIAGGTDAHTGLSTSDDNNYWGKYSNEEPGEERSHEKALEFPSGSIMAWKLGASGYTAVWATANTREALWDAMKRRETYASTGPRMKVRFFGGYGYTESDLKGSNMPEVGYSKGVPMGGDIAGKAGQVPNFMIYAWKDPQDANLDRVQVIKGWLDEKGNTHEKIYNVVWSDMDKRPMSANGKIPPVGNTVNLEDATWKDNIGAQELKAVWTDPDFNPSVKAFYYLRVLQIPTPRWTAYDAVKFKFKQEKDVWMIHQERAYTSPIWYNPK